MKRTSRIVLNTRLIKKLLKSGEPLQNLRIYCICRRHFAHRSGLFSIAEVLDILHSEYRKKSLHARPGNKRAAYREWLTKQLQVSILFRPLSDGRYKFQSQRKLTNAKQP